MLSAIEPPVIVLDFLFFLVLNPHPISQCAVALIVCHAQHAITIVDVQELTYLFECTFGIKRKLFIADLHKTNVVTNEVILKECI